jgi:2-dehydro-3-deoxyphosphogluconate aldolase/(4S)-4-hydroxy-2-oxoglutarate aldolase
MARTVTETEVSNALLRRRVIPVVVIGDLEVARPLAEALDQGGLPVAEVTFRTEAAADAVRLLADETSLLVGAGTVVRPEQVDLAVEAGARFIVMPGISPRVVERCKELDVLVIPGVATATEVIAALDHGLDILKLFPAEVAGGVPLLRALQGPFPSVRWFPTGGVTEANAAAYLALPSVAAVGGSWMVAPELIAARDFATVTHLARRAVRLGAGEKP